MCFFPLVNNNITGIAYRKGVREFDCGACPECLRKRSNSWALRAVYESKSHVSNYMVTLTYDNFVRDPKTGRILGETPVDPDLSVNKRDVQLFIKRLRKWYSSISNEPIKYIACAEYGSRTHRAHYHCILFGVKFSDIHFYKKSKRGNPIYMSNTLTSLWNHGICTVDSINVHSAVARYCTKYCAKSRSDNTFMLCSQRIGLDNLLKDFNGYSYFIDGREYTIPRIVWQEYIMNKYSSLYPAMSCKYVNRSNVDNDFYYDSAFWKSRSARRLYRYVRDNDSVYKSYLSYWQFKGSCYESIQPSVSQRIRLLPDRKFHNYKIAALECLKQRRKWIPVIAPGSGCVSAYYRYRDCLTRHCPDLYKFQILSLARYSSRPNRASDTDISIKYSVSDLIPVFCRTPFDIYQKQLSFFV